MLACAGPLSLAQQEGRDANRLDQYGDPLPAGASTRFGTVRMRAYVQKFAFAPDGKTFVSGGQDWDPSIRIWEVATGKQLRHWNAHTWEVLSISYLDGGGKIASAAADGTVRVWETATGKELQSVQLSDHLKAVALAPDRGS
jgi:WD40 repeat protein